MPKPGQLPLGVLIARVYETSFGRVAGLHPEEMWDELAIPDGSHARRFRSETRSEKRTHFLHQPSGQHGLATCADALAQLFAGTFEEDHGHRGHFTGRPWPSEDRGERFPRQLVDFESTAHSLPIARGQSSGARGVPSLQLAVERLRPFSKEARFESLAHLGRRTGERVEASREHLPVEARAADREHRTSPCGDLGAGIEEQRSIPSRRASIGRIEDIDQMMGHPRAFRDGRLRGADLEPPVELPAVDRHDFTPELLGQAKSNLGLPHRGRAGQKSDREHGATQ